MDIEKKVLLAVTAGTELTCGLTTDEVSELGDLFTLLGAVFTMIANARASDEEKSADAKSKN
jgi:hypothetical protein